MKTAVATITTKLDALTALGLLREGESHQDKRAWVGYLFYWAPCDAAVTDTDCFFVQTRAKNRLVVTACLSGTDYAVNIRGKSFGSIRSITAKIDDADKVDLLLFRVCVLLGLRIIMVHTFHQCFLLRKLRSWKRLVFCPRDADHFLYHYISLFHPWWVLKLMVPCAV